MSTRKALELKPDCAEAHSNLGGILLRLGKLKEAELSLRLAIEIKPELAISYLNLSLILYSKGDLDSALEILERDFFINSNSKDIQLLKSIFRKRRNGKLKQVMNSVSTESHQKKTSSFPIILYKSVDDEIVNSLYKIKTMDLNKYLDPSFGNAKGSD